MWPQVDDQRRQDDDFEELRRAAIERLATDKALLPSAGGDEEKMQLVDVYKLTRTQKKLIVEKAVETQDQDAFQFLSKIKNRLDR